MNELVSWSVWSIPKGEIARMQRVRGRKTDSLKVCNIRNALERIVMDISGQTPKSC